MLSINTFIDRDTGSQITLFIINLFSTILS